MNQIPNIEEDSKEEFLHLLHQVVQHTPLKIEETAGTDYDRGYIFYQDMVLRDVEEFDKKTLRVFIDGLEDKYNQI